MHRLLGNDCMESTSSLVMASSAPGMGNPLGADPVAMMMLPAL